MIFLQTELSSNHQMLYCSLWLRLAFLKCGKEAASYVSPQTSGRSSVVVMSSGCWNGRCLQQVAMAAAPLSPPAVYVTTHVFPTAYAPYMTEPCDRAWQPVNVHESSHETSTCSLKPTESCSFRWHSREGAEQQKAYEITPLLAGHALGMACKDRSKFSLSPDEEKKLQPVSWWSVLRHSACAPFCGLSVIWHWALCPVQQRATAYTPCPPFPLTATHSFFPSLSCCERNCWNEFNLTLILDLKFLLASTLSPARPPLIE